jgi:nitrite reductase/ring-hydroxylating ferredoxin subunit
MIPGIEAPERTLGRLDDIPDGGTRAFPAAPGSFSGLFAVRRGDTVMVYVNSCPHVGLPLDGIPGRFLSGDGTEIVCTSHGARFRIADGYCTLGPCIGERLEAVPVRIVDGELRVPADAGL